jgi:hypothetical protein
LYIPSLCTVELQKTTQHLTAKIKMDVACPTISLVLVDIILRYLSLLYLVTIRKERPRHQTLGSVRTVIVDPSSALRFESLTIVTMKSAVS